MAPISLFLLLASGDALARGQSAFQAGDLAAAEREFRAHLKTFPASAEATSNLAAVLARRERYPEAVTLYRKALRLNPKLTPVYFNLGVAQLRSADYAGCAGSFEKFLGAHSTESRAWQLLGLCRLESGDATGAIVALDRAPRDPAALFLLATAHAREGDENRAVELLAGLESQPAQALLVEALVDMRRENFGEARGKLERALAADPSLTPAQTALARLNLRENRDEEAIGQFEAALAKQPHDAESTYQLGVAYDRVGRTAEGREKLNRALALRANYADPHYQLARIDFREKRYPAALAHLDVAAKLLPKQESVRLLRARVYQALGRKAEADREFAEVRRLKAEAMERRRLEPMP